MLHGCISFIRVFFIGGGGGGGGLGSFLYAFTIDSHCNHSQDLDVLSIYFDYRPHKFDC